MYNRKLVFTAACLGMLLFGITMTTLGPILPKIMIHYGIDKSGAGTLFTLMSFGILVGSLVFGPVVDRYGYKGLLAGCTVLVLAGLEGIAYSGTMTVLGFAVCIYGFGGGILNGGTNALVSDISEEKRSAGLALLGVFFGIGAFGIPFILGFLLDTFSYRNIIGGLGIIVLLPFLFFLLISFPRPKQNQGFPIAEGTRLLGEVTLLLLGLILFFESGMEITVGGWTTTYFNEELALSANRAVFFQSLFWIGMMLARLLLNRILRNRNPQRVLVLFLGIAFAGSLMMLISHSLILATPGIFLIGFGLAATYPVILGYVGDLWPKLTGTAFSIVLTMALIGGMLLPWLTGFLGDDYGLRISFLIIPVSLVLLVSVLMTVIRRISGRKITT